MATSGNRKDVQLVLDVESVGEDGIDRLRKAVKQLADQGDIAATEFQALSAQIDGLASQQTAVRGFEQLSDAVAQLTQRQEQTQARLDETTAALQRQNDVLDAARAKQQEATTAYASGQKAVIEAGARIRELKTDYDTAGRATEEYAAKLRAANAALTQARVEVVDLRAAQRAATSEVTELGSEYSKLETQVRRAATANERAVQSLREQQDALAQAASSAQTLGVATEDLGAAEAGLVESFANVSREIQRRNDAANELIESDRQLAIQERTLAALYAEAEQELQAYAAAEREAADAAQRLAAAQDLAAQRQVRWEEEARQIVQAADAQQQLARQTQITVTALREVAEINAFEKAAADAQKLVQASNYVRFWEQELERAEYQANALAQATERAAERMEGAFAAVGVRSVEAVRQELEQVRAAMEALRDRTDRTGETLTGAFTSGEARVQSLERELRQLNGTLTTSDRLANAFHGSLAQISAGNIIADAVGYLVNKVKEMGGAFVDAIVQGQKLSRALNAIYKDANISAAQIDFLRSISLSAGVALDGIQQSFIKFSASANAANIPLAQSNALFESLVRAGGTLGLSTEEVGGALEALSQMAAKGTVSMEELRQQLGDRLPGAFSLVAKGLGITEAQLIKLVESGNLAARDLFPALTKSLQQLQGDVTGLAPAWQQFTNFLTQAAQSAGDSLWAQVLTGALRALSVVLGFVVLAFTGFSEAVGVAAKTVGVLIAAIRSGTNPLKELERIVDEAAERQSKLTQAWRVSSGVANTASAAAQQNVVATKAATAAHVSLTQTVAATAEGQKVLALATQLSANTTLEASQKWTQFNVALSETLKNLEAASLASDKNAKAIKEEGETLVALAQLRGGDRAALEAQVTAATNYAAALSRSAAAHSAETEALRVQRAFFLEQAAARGLNEAEIQKEIVAMDAKIGKSQAEGEQARAAAAAAQLEVASRQLTRQAYEDNSEAIDRLFNAMMDAQEAANALRGDMARGLATQEQVRAADIAASQARGLFNDALKDSIAKIQQLAQVEQARLNMQTSGLVVQQRAYEQMAAANRVIAEQTGSTEALAAAIYYEIEAKRIQIQITNLQTQAKKIEAQAELEAVNAERQALVATNELTPAKQRELEIRTLNAKAKLLEANASESVVKGIQAEIDALLRKSQAVTTEASGIGASTAATQANTASRETNTNAINAQTGALGKLASASEAAAAAERKRLNVDKDGFTLNSSGQRLSGNSDVATRTGIVNFLKSAGLTEEQAIEVSKDFIDSKGDVPFFNNPGQIKYGGTSMTVALTKAAEKVRFGQTGGDPTLAGKKNSGTSTTAADTSGSTAPANTGGNYTVVVNLGGVQTTIAVKDATSQNALVALFQQLQAGKNTTAIM